MESRLTPRQMLSWIAYFNRFPFGHVQDHLMIAKLISALLLVNGERKSPAEFMPSTDKEDDSESAMLSLPGAAGFLARMQADGNS